MLAKDATITRLVAQLDLPARGWIVVDHWEADLCAVGLAAADEPARLVHVSTFLKPAGRYDYECELPASEPDRPYAVAGRGTDVGYDELLAVLIGHLGERGARP